MEILKRSAYALMLVLWMLVGILWVAHAHAACIDCKPAAAAALPAPSAPVVVQSTDAQLAEDFSAATAEACAPTSATDPSPIDPLACTCNQFITAALPTLKPDGSQIVGPVSALERLRVIKIRGQTSDFRTKFQAACGGLLMSIRDDAMTVAAFVKMLAP